MTHWRLNGASVRSVPRANLWLAPLLCLWACASTTPHPPLVAQPAASQPAPRALPVTLSVLTTNDVHGRIQQLPLLGGYVANLRRVREREGGGVLLIDAGDIFQGTLESNLGEGAAAVAAFNALGYAAAAVGNHEFDYGPAGPAPTPAPGDDPLGALRARVAESHFPFLSANLRGKPDSPFPIAAVHPSAMLRVAGVKIGVVGGITEGALTRTHPANTGGISVVPLAASIAAEAKSLRRAGAVLVIATVHAGGECAAFDDPSDLTSCDTSAEVFELARHLEPGDIDLIVAGHTHKGIAHEVHGIPVVEAFSEGRAFGRVDLQVDPVRGVVGHRIFPPTRLCSERMQALPCTSEVYEGAPVLRAQDVEQAIAPHLAAAAVARERPLGVEVTSAVTPEHDFESALGNLMVDLMREAFPRSSVAINNGGSVRTYLPAGKLTFGQFFEVFPFDNVFADVSLSAAELSAMIAANLQNDRGFLSLSGLTARARCTRNGLMVQLLRRDGSVVPSRERLSVVTSDFLALGGDGLMQGVPRARVRLRDGALMRDTLVQRLSLRAKLDGRDPALLDPKHPRVAYVGQRPLRCPPTL